MFVEQCFELSGDQCTDVPLNFIGQVSSAAVKNDELLRFQITGPLPYLYLCV